MPYKTISVDEKTLTIMGVPFPDISSLRKAASALGSNMFEGFQPTPKGIELIRDYCLGKITFMQLAAAAKNKAYE